MKICYFNYVHDYREASVGSFVHVMEFTRAFRELGHTIESSSLFLKKDSAGKSERYRSKEPVWKTKLRKFYYEPRQVFNNFRFFFKEWKIIRSFRPDVIVTRHSPYFFTSPVLGRLYGIPVILEINALGQHLLKTYIRFHVHYPGFSFFEKISLKLCSAATVTSRELKDILVDYRVPEAKITVNPMGVDPGKICPHTDSGLKKSLGLSGKVIFGFIGSINYWHGMDNLMEMMKRTVSALPRIAYLIVGDGPKRQELEDFVRQNGLGDRVKCTGYVPYEEINLYLNAMDVCLALYPLEKAFFFSPLKIFEYMAAGRPVVATSVGQIREIIRHGENGFLVDPDRPREIEALFRKLMNDSPLRKRIGESARTFISTNYSWHRNAKTVERVAQNLIRKT